MGACAGGYRCGACRRYGPRRSDDFERCSSCSTRGAVPPSGRPSLAPVRAGRAPPVDRRPLGRRARAASSSATRTLERTQDVVVAASDRGVGDALTRTRRAARARARLRARRGRQSWLRTCRSMRSCSGNGFAHDREILRMWRTLDGDLPQPAWPDGVTVRTYTDADARARARAARRRVRGLGRATTSHAPTKSGSRS